MSNYCCILSHRVNGHLGSGQFGSVEQGLWRNGARSIQVALKCLKEEASELDKVRFLQEAAIMAQFRHPNIVSLYGVVTRNKPVSDIVRSCTCMFTLQNYLSVDAGG